MPNRKPLTHPTGKVSELSVADMRRMRLAPDALPESLRAKVFVRSPQKSPIKERITIRVSPDVVQRFRATGDGWQTRVDAALQDWLKSDTPI